MGKVPERRHPSEPSLLSSIRPSPIKKLTDQRHSSQTRGLPKRSCGMRKHRFASRDICDSDSTLLNPSEARMRESYRDAVDWRRPR